jgi:DNA-binding protein Alba
LSERRNRPAQEESAADPQEQLEASDESQQPVEVTERRVSPPNHVFVGKKPVMSYAMSAMVQLAQSGEIVIKARGMVISRAVDVAEIVTKRLGNNAFDVKDIKIDTERVGEGAEARNVSTIEIVVARK